MASRYTLLILFGIVSMQLMSCGVSDRTDTAPTVMLPTSTTSPLFLEPATPTPFRVASATPVVTRPPKPTAIEATTPTVEPIGIRYTTLDIYDEQLLSNWTLKNTTNMKYRNDFKGYAYTGKNSIIATPQSTGQLQFSLLPSSKVAYKRSEVAGISFWISSDQMITPEDFAVTVFGSNDYPYWVAKDTSVKITGRVTDDLPLFSETRLYYLNFNSSIKPKTWAEVILWLDDLVYEPEYMYVTGLYIKNDERFQEPFYIDKVSLILYKN